jgi:hypothetical protein
VLVALVAVAATQPPPNISAPARGADELAARLGSRAVTGDLDRVLREVRRRAVGERELDQEVVCGHTGPRHAARVGLARGLAAIDELDRDVVRLVADARRGDGVEVGDRRIDGHHDRQQGARHRAVDGDLAVAVSHTVGLEVGRRTGTRAAGRFLVAVAVVLVRVAVAVVVVAVVAVLGSIRADVVLAIVAVFVVVDVGARLVTGIRRGRARAVAVAVAVVVPGVRVHGVVVHRSVAVVVRAVADLRRAGVDGAVAVVAVVVVGHVARGLAAGVAGRGAVPLAVAVRIPVEGRLDTLVDVAVAVVVDLVADLGLAGVRVLLAVVAVFVTGVVVRAVHLAHVVAVFVGTLDGGAIRVAVAVRVQVAGLETIAVLVDLVARHLGFTRVHVGVGVVAVLVVVDVARRHIAGVRRVVEVAEAILVVVGVPGRRVRRVVLVRVAVAVVVRAVADLVHIGVHVCVAVVAVLVVAHEVGRLLTGTGVDLGVAEAVAISVLEPDVGVEGVVVVHHAIAVTVDLVAVLVRIGVHVCVAVVAVELDGRVGRTLDVDHAIVGLFTGLRQLHHVAEAVLVAVVEPLTRRRDQLVLVVAVVVVVDVAVRCVFCTEGFAGTEGVVVAVVVPGGLVTLAQALQAAVDRGVVDRDHSRVVVVVVTGTPGRVAVLVVALLVVVHDAVAVVVEAVADLDRAGVLTRLGIHAVGTDELGPTLREVLGAGRAPESVAICIADHVAVDAVIRPKRLTVDTAHLGQDQKQTHAASSLAPGAEM